LRIKLCVSAKADIVAVVEEGVEDIAAAAVEGTVDEGMLTAWVAKMVAIQKAVDCEHHHSPLQTRPAEEPLGGIEQKPVRDLSCTAAEAVGFAVDESGEFVVQLDH
jgi:hypothetical protein